MADWLARPLYFTFRFKLHCGHTWFSSDWVFLVDCVLCGKPQEAVWGETWPS